MSSDVAELAWADARARAASVAYLLDSELIELADADGRTLARDAHALCDLPTADNSAMDGWAVAGQGPWRIVGEALAGNPLDRALDSGMCVRIGTGGIVPSGATAVLRWEHATERDGFIDMEPGAALADGTDIRPAGLECRAGDVVIEAGTELRPSAIGLLAGTGHDRVEVRRRPRVTLLILGDELLHSGVPSGGKVRDSLGPQLPAWFRRLGAEVTSVVHVVDELDQLIETLRVAEQTADMVVTSGSTADGPRDYLHSALDAVGADLVVDRVRVRPGHPMLLARFPSGVPLLGLPGNPQSAVVGLMSLGAPVLGSMLGRREAGLTSVVLDEDVVAPADFNRLVIGRNDSGRFVSLPWIGSNMLRGLALATGFAVVPAGRTPAGTTVPWLALP